MTDTLKQFEAAWTNTPSAHAAVRDAFVVRVDGDQQLDAHRTLVERTARGFGERAFHWLWKLVVDDLPPAFKFLEVGVFRGQTVSLVGLLAKRADKAADVVAVSSFNGQALEWEPRDYEPEVHDFFRETVGGYEDARLVTVRGDSTDPQTVGWAADLGPYDVVYVDGGHDYETAKKDVLNYAPLVKVGGYLVVDDCANRFDMPFGFFCGIADVSRVVDELLPLGAPATLPDGSTWSHVGSVVHVRLWRRVV